MKLAFPVATPETADETMLALRGDLAEHFRLLSKLDYAGAELMVRDPAQLDADKIRTLATEAGLSIPAVSTGQLRKEDGLQLCHLDLAERRRAVARTKAVIDFAAALGAPQVNIGTLRGQLPGGAQREAAIRAAVESLSELLSYAEGRGVGLAIEPQNRFVINWLNTVGEALGWLDSFAPHRCSLLYDAYHALFEERSLYASLIRAFPRVSHVQVADTNRLAPGGGQFNFAEFVRVLAALGYEGYISVEALPRPTAAEAARRAARCLLPLLVEEEEFTEYRGEG